MYLNGRLLELVLPQNQQWAAMSSFQRGGQEDTPPPSHAGHAWEFSCGALFLLYSLAGHVTMAT